jgi:large repetitive protein
MTTRWKLLWCCAAGLLLACGDHGASPDARADASDPPVMVDAAPLPIDAAVVPDAPAPDAHTVVCGDGVVEQEEACDGEVLAGRTCLTQGFYQGALRCTASCTLDTSDCSGSCGDGIVNGPETCDVALAVTESCRAQGFLGGVPGCAPGCVPAGCTDGLSIDDVDVVFHGNGPDSHLGDSVTFVGDFDGDGYQDLAITASNERRPEGRFGAAYLVYGSVGANPNLGEAARIADDAWTQSASFTGVTVSAAGDVDRDGFSDLLVALGSGELTYLVFGGERLTGDVDLRSLTGDAERAAIFETPTRSTFITSPFRNVAGIPDATGDGRPDLVIGHWPSEELHGAVYLVRGQADRFSAATITLPPPLPQLPEGPVAAMFFDPSQTRQLGRLVAGGDLDGDGISDLVILAPRDSEYFVFYGPFEGVLTPADASAVIIGTDNLGTSLAVTDVDGDSYADLLIEERASFTSGQSAVRIFPGERFRLRGTFGIADAPRTVTVSHVGQNGSATIGSGGDVDGDGHPDLVVGDLFAQIVGGGEGRARLVRGPILESSFLAEDVPWISGEDGFNPFFAKEISLGDFNGDGFADIALGIPSFAGAPGQVLLVHGARRAAP